jgi:hypothetical protein
MPVFGEPAVPTAMQTVDDVHEIPVQAELVKPLAFGVLSSVHAAFAPALVAPTATAVSASASAPRNSTARRWRRRSIDDIPHSPSG